MSIITYNYKIRDSEFYQILKSANYQVGLKKGKQIIKFNNNDV